MVSGAQAVPSGADAISFGLDFPRTKNFDLQKASELGLQNGFQFVVVPLSTGGNSAKSRKLKLTRTEALSNPEDFQYTVGKIADFVDFKAPEKIFEHEIIFNQEASWAAHLGMGFVILPVRASTSLALTSVLVNAIQQYQFLNLILPFEMNERSWIDWNRIRTACGHHERIKPALIIRKEIPDEVVIAKWFGEAIQAFQIDYEVMCLESKSTVSIPPTHIQLLRRLWALPSATSVIVTGASACKIEPFRIRLACRNVADNQRGWHTSQQEAWVKDYCDVLQNPLQPLMNNLSYSTYASFERDTVKYITYERAIHARLHDLKNLKGVEKPFIVMICGAGRGPLVDCSIRASGQVGVKIKLWVVEKNPNAMVTLEMKMGNHWKDHDVTLVHTDMREFNPDEKADIIVSELLGSFGDNELSPECLDGVEHILAQDGISIPSEYTSYIAPITTTNLHRKVFKKESRFETPYVVNLHLYYQISPSMRCWSFEHPSKSKSSGPLKNSRFCNVEFEPTQTNCTVHGFAGYFRVKLYQDIMLSIEPTDATENMYSWFPLFFPLVVPQTYHKGEKITLNMWRKVSKQKVWYEWMISGPRPSALHNPGGRSYWVGL